MRSAAFLAVTDEAWRYAGCRDGTVYDLTERTPRAAFVIAPIVCGNAQPVRFIQQQLAHGQGFGGGVPGRCRIGGGMVLGFGGNRLCRDFPPADDDWFGDHRASFRERTTWYPGRLT